MNAEEYAAKSKELVDWMNRQSRMEDEIAALKGGYKEPIKQAKEKVEELRMTLNTQTTSRKVRVAQIFNWTSGMTFQRRLDTGEVIPGSIRKIEDREKQESLTEPQEELTQELLALPAPEVVQSTTYEEVSTEKPDSEPSTDNTPEPPVSTEELTDTNEVEEASIPEPEEIADLEMGEEEIDDQKYTESENNGE
jgi:hypothetical protein